jgi:hypothetical protein
MQLTGVQPVGAKGLSTLQASVVDGKDTGRLGASDSRERGPALQYARAGEPQPVVFPREGTPLDQRPVDLRREHATARYREDGGDPQHDRRDEREDAA